MAISILSSSTSQDVIARHLEHDDVGLGSGGIPARRLGQCVEAARDAARAQTKALGIVFLPRRSGHDEQPRTSPCRRCATESIPPPGDVRARTRPAASWLRGDSRAWRSCGEPGPACRPTVRAPSAPSDRAAGSPARGGTGPKPASGPAFRRASRSPSAMRPSTTARVSKFSANTDSCWGPGDDQGHGVLDRYRLLAVADIGERRQAADHAALADLVDHNAISRSCTLPEMM